jgi:hypothetical protein
MKNYDWKKLLSEQRLMLQEKGYQVLYLALYGSQNYNLDEHSELYTSDFDTKAVVLPSLRDLVEGKRVSEVLDTPVGQCDVKDVRSFFEVLVKGNPAYLEVMVADCQWVNPHYRHLWDWDDEKFEKFFKAVYKRFAKAAYGMALQKEKALTHPYPSVLAKVEKYGYDGKQLHHVVRLLDLYRKTKAGVPFKQAMKYSDENEMKVLMALKTHNPTLQVEEAVGLARSYVNTFKLLVDEEVHGDWWVDQEELDRVQFMGENVTVLAVYDEVLRDRG